MERWLRFTRDSGSIHLVFSAWAGCSGFRRAGFHDEFLRLLKKHRTGGICGAEARSNAPFRASRI